MTRKHFAAIAANIAAAYQRADDRQRIALRDLAHLHAVTFATINPNFDRERFLRDCYVQR